MKSGIFPIEATQAEGLTILIPKQMLQGLPIGLEIGDKINITLGIN